MDDYMFRKHVQNCKNVVEATSYLEIFNYSDPSYNSIEQHPLTPDEFENFLHRRGAFAPRDVPEGVEIRSGIRLMFVRTLFRVNLGLGSRTKTMPIVPDSS
ncbi:hypothetical protein VTK73DRAFT_5547 [Phialemonium thermophilum]|uniref:Uncharacterized protein n=1 Tax=Phialemonium thermophilum TaxID=223376 RepID=A0ABR3V1D4_9PEZI